MAYIKKIENKKGISYQVNIRAANIKPIYKTFKGKKALTQAQKWASIIEGQIADGSYVDTRIIVEESVKNIDDMTAEEVMLYRRNHIETISDLLNYYKDYVAPNKYSHPEKYTTMYEWWINRIGNVKVKQLTSAMLSVCKQILMTEEINKTDEEGNKLCRNYNTVNKYLMAMSAPLTYAVKELEIIDVNPMSKIDTLPKPEGRDRCLNDEEKKILTIACKNKSMVVLIFYLLLLHTGGRYSEVLHLKVENIDQKNKRVHFKKTKNKTNRGVGINDMLLNLINKYLKDNDIKTGYIFLKKGTNNFIYMRGILQKIIKDTGIKDFHIHDLRHTFASKMAEEGASLLDIATILGHKSLVMARRYSHLTQERTDNIARNAALAMNISELL